MAGRSVIHETFRIERTYAAAPSMVFAAFSTKEARNSWGDSDDLEPSEDQDDVGDSEVSEFDFRVGGREFFSTKEQGTTYRYDGRYHDIVTDNRIVYSYEMYADGARISVSVATIEFTGSESTQLIWTEQGVYLDGYNRAEAPEMRKAGTIDMLDGLTAYLQRQSTA
jgi:uncharacterized protein YndB with AHSA1/START domain